MEAVTLMELKEAVVSLDRQWRVEDKLTPCWRRYHEFLLMIFFPTFAKSLEGCNEEVLLDSAVHLPSFFIMSKAPVTVRIPYEDQALNET